MVAILHVENCVAEDDERPLVTMAKSTGQGIILCLHNHLVAKPLPKLTLGSPELSTIRTDHPRSSFLTFSSFLFAQFLVQADHSLS